MDDTRAYASPIAAEAVGERLGSPPSGAAEQAVRPAATSAGPKATVADKTAESVGERVGDAYADATTDQARERSQKVVRHSAMGGGPQTGGAAIFRAFDQQTLATVVAAFAMGYVAGFLLHRHT